jgi:hypothetical protein
VGDVRQPGDAADEEDDDGPLDDEHLAGVPALGRAERADRVGDGLDAGQRGAAVGERLQQHVDHREADQTLGAVTVREGAAGGVVLVDVVKITGDLPDQPGDDHQPD